MMAGGRWPVLGESGGRTLIYLARHGQTPLNESGVLRGLADPPLDETGQDQAQRRRVISEVPSGCGLLSPARYCGRGRPRSRSPSAPGWKWQPTSV